MFGRKTEKIKRLKQLEQEISYLNADLNSHKFQLKQCRNGDAYKNSWKILYLEALVELQKANKGSRRLRRRLDRQILLNKENKP